MGKLCNAGFELPYGERMVTLQKNHIALWDVLQACNREGSLDGDIQLESEIANDLPGLLHDHSTIRAIGFNGNKAWMAFRRMVLPVLDTQLTETTDLYLLPSTSPANARFSYEQKLSRWQVLEQYL